MEENMWGGLLFNEIVTVTAVTLVKRPYRPYFFLHFFIGRCPMLVKRGPSGLLGMLYQLLIANYQLPFTSYQLPLTTHYSLLLISWLPRDVLYHHLATG